MAILVFAAMLAALVLAVVLIIKVVGFFADTPAATVPGQSNYNPCASTAFDPAHLGPSCGS